MGHFRADNITQPPSPERNNQLVTDVNVVTSALRALSVDPRQATDLEHAIENISLEEPPTAGTTSTTETPSPGDTSMEEPPTAGTTSTTETPSPGDTSMEEPPTAGTTSTTEPSADDSAGVDIRQETTTPPPTYQSVIEKVLGEDIKDYILKKTAEALSPGPKTDRTAPPRVIRPPRKRARPNQAGEQSGFARRRLDLGGEAAGGAARTISLERFNEIFADENPENFFPTQYQAPQSLIGTEWDSSDGESSTTDTEQAATNAGAATNAAPAATNAAAAATDAGSAGTNAAAATDTEQAANGLRQRTSRRQNIG